MERATTRVSSEMVLPGSTLFWAANENSTRRTPALGQGQGEGPALVRERRMTKPSPISTSHEHHQTDHQCRDQQGMGGKG